MDKNLEFLKDELPDRYVVEDTLGQGGIGIVFKATDTVLDKTVAIKMLMSRLSGPQVVRFHTEAKALAKLKHANILNAQDFQITEAGTPFLVLDYIEGRDLDSYIEESGPMDTDLAISLFFQIIDGLAYAHNHSIIHRDIKPSNVMLVEDASGAISIKIVDFGLSKIGEEEQRITSTGAVIGSPLYMSPEQAKGEMATIASDIYSLGCLFYKVLTGSAPVEDESYLRVITRKLSEKVPPLSKAYPSAEFTNELEAIVSRMLAINPEERYHCLADVRADLESLSQEDFERPSQNLVEKSKPEVSSGNRMVPELVAGVLLLMIGSLSILFFVFFNRTESSGNLVKTNHVSKRAETIVPGDSRGSVEQAQGSLEKAMRDTRFDLEVEGNGQYVLNSLGPIEDEDLKVLEGDKSFSALLLIGSHITGRGLKYISTLKNCKNLRGLELKDAPIEDKDLEALLDLKSLSTLKFNGCSKITAAGLKTVSQFKKLAYLGLQHLHISVDGCAAIAKIPNLNRLDLRNVRGITGEGITKLSSVKALERIDIGGSDVDAASISALHRLKKLSNLQLEHISYHAIKDGFSGLGDSKSIDFISIRNCNELPANLGKNLSKIDSLHQLMIKECTGVNRQIIDSLTNIEQLQSLHLLNCDLKGLGRSIGKLSCLKKMRHIILDSSAQNDAVYLRARFPDSVIIEYQ